MEFKTDTLCKMVRRISNNVKNENKMFVNTFYIIKLSNAEYLFKKNQGRYIHKNDLYKNAQKAKIQIQIHAYMYAVS